MIFGGALNALRCTMKLEQPNADQKSRCVLGITIDRRCEKDTTRHSVRCQIKVFEREPAPETEKESVVLLKNYLGTMLHEMIHAFFSIYVCKCNEKCRHKVLEFEQSGVTGHGLHWQNAARCIERFVRYGLRMDLRLGREEALGLELVIGNKEIWYVDLKKLGLDYEAVEREMNWYAHLNIQEREEEARIAEEKDRQAEELEKEKEEQQENAKEEKERWEKERPQRERKLKNARIRILTDLRKRSSHAKWKGIFKRTPRSILKPLPPTTSQPGDPIPNPNPAPPHSSRRPPNFMLARRSLHSNPNSSSGLQNSPSIATRRRLEAELKTLKTYPFGNWEVNPNIPNAFVSDVGLNNPPPPPPPGNPAPPPPPPPPPPPQPHYQSALRVRKNTYTDPSKRSRDFLLLRQKHTYDPSAAIIIGKSKLEGKGCKRKGMNILGESRVVDLERYWGGGWIEWIGWLGEGEAEAEGVIEGGWGECLKLKYG